MQDESKSEFHVATDGDDTWSGTLAVPNRQGTDGPFATLQRARDEIRKLRISDEGVKRFASGIVRSGKYYLDETLVLGSGDGEHRSTP